ncbi:hypothetical protein TNCV_1831131 [Trichonephila clavipes]|nr:hypothetical protein TNCV_1831131 [Trichonephila clavipes]
MTKSVTKHARQRQAGRRGCPLFCFPSTWSVKHPETATSLSTDAGPATVQYLGMPRQGEGHYSGLAHVAPNLGERGNASSKDRRTLSASVY